MRIEKPLAAAQSIAAVDVAAIHTGGCGACNGLGSTPTWSLSLLKNLSDHRACSSATATVGHVRKFVRS